MNARLKPSQRHDGKASEEEFMRLLKEVTA